ncbi:MAG TPA: PEP-CTERM sorting domain-containing protein [Bryobacteraceae bacterium]
MNLSTRGFRSCGRWLLPATFMLAPALVNAGPVLGPITGGFGITGPGVLVFNDGADYIQFCNMVSGASCSGPVTATGTVSVTGPGTGDFGPGELDLTAGDPGTIDNTTDMTPPTPPYTYLPINIPVTIDNYLALAGFSNLDFQADLLPLVTCTTTATQACIGPFELSQGTDGTSVTMDVTGTLINEADGSKSPLSVILTGQYAGLTISQVESGATSPTGVFSNSWSASITAGAVPEPGTSGMMLLAGAGLVALASFRRQRKS